MKKVGLIGWRGMVGSMLMKRMQEEGDFRNISPFYFSTSAAGKGHRSANGVSHVLLDANSVEQVGQMDIVVTCQGGEYTKLIYPKLRDAGWQGYWIDAASAKRMDDDSIIVLDPVNREQIESGTDAGIRNFIGGNCSISLSLVGLTGLFKASVVDWMSMMTYQAASGAGAAHVKELLAQMIHISKDVKRISQIRQRQS
jgi:aspartate-semialdehyde dehydrogenase